jgi:hypothetical protein
MPVIRLAPAALVFVGALTLVTSGSVSAAPTNSVTNNGNGTATVTYTTTESVIYVCASAVSVADCGFNANPLYQWGNLGGVDLLGDTLEVTGGMGTEAFGGGFTTLPGGTYTIVLWPNRLRAGAVGGITIAISAPEPDPDPDPQADASRSEAPEPLLQQVPMPVGASCADVSDEQFSWGTDVRGGWSSTWSQWANGGFGGAVCSRTLTYSGSWQIT